MDHDPDDLQDEDEGPLWTSAQVQAEAERLFGAQAPEVLALLATCAADQDEESAARIRLAVLKLSGGRREELPGLLAEAGRDWRNVLLWAGG